MRPVSLLTKQPPVGSLDAGFAETPSKLDALTEESAQAACGNWFYNNATRSSAAAGMELRARLS